MKENPSRYLNSLYESLNNHAVFNRPVQSTSTGKTGMLCLKSSAAVKNSYSTTMCTFKKHLRNILC
jgi:hypothetical protein